MAFKASKERGRRKTPMAQGKPMLPNAGIADWYSRELLREVNAMFKEYRVSTRDSFKDSSVRAFYAEDASPTNVFKKSLTRLRKKWEKRFSELAQRLAPKFVSKAANYSEFRSKHVLKDMGIADPRSPKSVEFHATLQASIQENVALITNIQQDFANRIEGAVYRSVASNNPNENGLSKVMEELLSGEGVTKRRAHNIAVDQNSKLYTNINKQRMQSNGMDFFRWKHSSAGKTQRHTHIERQTQDVGYGPGVFRFDSPELWQGPQADQGLPGEAINCKCYMIPVFMPEMSDD